MKWNLESFNASDTGVQLNGTNKYNPLQLLGVPEDGAIGVLDLQAGQANQLDSSKKMARISESLLWDASMKNSSKFHRGNPDIHRLHGEGSLEGQQDISGRFRATQIGYLCNKR